jgi:hypothetical protein
MIDMIASIHNEVCEIPAEYKDLAEELRENIIESAANFDADILEKYFAGEPISNEELKPALLHAVAAGAVVLSNSVLEPGIYAGIPAKKVKDASEAIGKAAHDNAQGYLMYKEWYK